MSKTITIKLTNAGSKAGPFTIVDEYGNVIAIDVSKDTLITGISYIVEDNVTMITLSSTGNCKSVKTIKVANMYRSDIVNTQFVETKSACLWRHLVSDSFNSYYGVIDPYIIEYPVSTLPNTEILQNIKSYDKVWIYLPDTTGVFSYTSKVAVDNIWFDNVIIYSNQQCTGLLELVPKPKNNLQAYNAYPMYKVASKVIIYTKSDDFYQINNFVDAVKDRSVPIAITSCESLSYDGILNQSNMDYTNNSFKKSQIRAKDLKIRLTLNSHSNIHIVSQLLFSSAQISYK
jgi:hypothetical protein